MIIEPDGSIYSFEIKKIKITEGRMKEGRMSVVLNKEAIWRKFFLLYPWKLSLWYSVEPDYQNWLFN